MIRKLPPDHEFDDVRNSKSGQRTRDHMLAVAQHRHIVADVKDLLQPVRDVERGHATPLQALENFKKAIDLLGGQGCRRFVENEKLAFVAKRLGDLDQLKLGNAEAARQCRRSHVEADLFQEFRRSAVHRLIVHQAISARQMLKQQVFCHREVGKRMQFLVNDPDARLERLQRRGRMVLFAVKQDVTVIRPENAAE